LGATVEDDGYLVTFVTDTNADTSECRIYAARTSAPVHSRAYNCRSASRAAHIRAGADGPKLRMNAAA